MGTVAGRPPGRQLWTTEEVCRRLRVSKPTLYAWAARHRVKRVKLGRGRTAGVRWPEEEVERLVRESLRTTR